MNRRDFVAAAGAAVAVAATMMARKAAKTAAFLGVAYGACLTCAPT